MIQETKNERIKDHVQQVMIVVSYDEFDSIK